MPASSEIRLITIWVVDKKVAKGLRNSRILQVGPDRSPLETSRMDAYDRYERADIGRWFKDAFEARSPTIRSQGGSRKHPPKSRSEQHGLGGYVEKALSDAVARMHRECSEELMPSTPDL